MNSLLNSTIPIITPKLPRTKVKVSPALLPMFSTICPFQIVGSEQGEGHVVLVLEGAGLPKSEWSTILCSLEGNKSIVELAGVNG